MVTFGDFVPRFLVNSSARFRGTQFFCSVMISTMVKKVIRNSDTAHDYANLDGRRQYLEINMSESACLIRILRMIKNRAVTTERRHR